MKVFIVLALAAVALAEPESDPALVGYSGIPAFTGYSGIPYTGYTGLYNRAVLPYSGYSTYNYGVPAYGRVFKREAEAESDPALVYGYSGIPAYTTGYTGYTGLPVTSYSGLYNSAVYPQSAYRFGAYSRLFKREAEAESDPAVILPGYTGYTGFSGLTGFTGYSPVATGYSGVYNPYNAYSTYNYGVPAYGRVFKREAESDPELVYTDGQFHTNLRNLNKGVHLNKALPYGSVYDVQSYKPVYTSPVTYAAKPVVPYTTGFYNYPGLYY